MSYHSKLFFFAHPPRSTTGNELPLVRQKFIAEPIIEIANCPHFLVTPGRPLRLMTHPQD